MHAHTVIKSTVLQCIGKCVVRVCVRGSAMLDVTDVLIVIHITARHELLYQSFVHCARYRFSM